MYVREKIRNKREELGLTLEELGDLVGVGKSTVGKWESGHIANMKRDNLEALAKALHVSPLYFMDIDEEVLTNQDIINLPIVGKVSCGKGVLCYEEISGYEPTPKDWITGGEFFYTKACGDSMINARICDGDLVLIRKQPDVDDGEIAAIVVDGNIFLKRVYKRNGTVILHSDNPAYPPKIISAKNIDSCFIVGKLKKVIIKY